MADKLLPFSYELEEEGDSGTIKIKARINPEEFLLNIKDKLVTLAPDDQESVKQAILTGKAMKIRNARQIKRFFENVNAPPPDVYEASPFSLTYVKPKGRAIFSHIEISQNPDTKTYWNSNNDCGNL